MSNLSLVNWRPLIHRFYLAQPIVSSAQVKGNRPREELFLLSPLAADGTRFLHSPLVIKNKSDRQPRARSIGLSVGIPVKHNKLARLPFPGSGHCFDQASALNCLAGRTIQAPARSVGDKLQTPNDYAIPVTLGQLLPTLRCNLMRKSSPRTGLQIPQALCFES